MAFPDVMRRWADEMEDPRAGGTAGWMIQFVFDLILWALALFALLGTLWVVYQLTAYYLL